MAALLFIPAGTLAYWQAWAFMAVFVGTSGAISVYLAIKDPQLLERRMKAGPAAEKERTQKVIMLLAMVGFIALLVIPALDHRFGWSRVPSYVSLAGDLLVALGFLCIFFVFRVNSYGASTIQLAEDQKVISSGPYAYVRHPMYAGGLIMLAGVPFALGSRSGLFVLLIMIPVLVWRLLDEEQFLAKNLPGYTEYQKKVRSRLIPGILLVTAALLPVPVPASAACDWWAAGGESVSSGSPAAPRQAPASVPAPAGDPAPAPAQEGTAGSQPAGAGQPPATFYETATVSARPLASATAAVTVLDRQEIERAGARTVAELLRFVPGVDVSTNGTRGGLTTAQIRGSKPTFTSVLVDGVQVNDPTYQVGDVFDLEGLPAAMVERVEIVRGPLSSVYGSTGLGGVINIITRQGKPGPAGGELEAAGGNASFEAAHGVLAGGLGGGSYALGLAWEEESRRIARDSFRQLSVLGHLSESLQPGVNLRLASRYSSWHGDDYPDASGGPLFGSGELRRSDHREASLGGEVIVDGGQHPSKWTASVYLHDLDRTSPAVPPQVPSSIESTAYTAWRAGGVATLFAGRHVHWSGGLDGSLERGENRSILEVSRAPGGEVRGDYDLTRTLLGAYSELLAERGGLSAELTARLDRPSALAGRRQPLEVDPRAGISYRMADGETRLHASAGRAFQLPSFFALASPRALGGNPGLRPETTVGGDAGIEHTFGAARLETAATLFYNHFHDLIDFDFRKFLHVNRSAVAARGVELSFRWRLADHLQVAANATCQEVTDLSTHAALLHQPRWVGGGRIDWQPAPGFSLRLDSQAVARTLDHELPVPGRSAVAGYQVLGLALSWQPSESWRLRGRVDNLTDRRYQTLIGFPGARRGFAVGLGHTL